jgi:hypothetical protein
LPMKVGIKPFLYKLYAFAFSPHFLTFPIFSS